MEKRERLENFNFDQKLKISISINFSKKNLLLFSVVAALCFAVTIKLVATASSFSADLITIKNLKNFNKFQFYSLNFLLCVLFSKLDFSELVYCRVVCEVLFS